jgi:hypothetical protein
MAKKLGMTGGDKMVEDLGKVVIGMLTIGLTAGVALIAGMKKIGETFSDELADFGSDDKEE